MDETTKKELKEIIDGMHCPKDFICYESGFETLCRAKDIGVERFLECMEEDPRKCLFSVPVGVASLCQCPLRVYIAKKLNK